MESGEAAVGGAQGVLPTPAPAASIVFAVQMTFLISMSNVRNGANLLQAFSQSAIPPGLRFPCSTATRGEVGREVPPFGGQLDVPPRLAGTEVKRDTVRRPSEGDHSSCPSPIRRSSVGVPWTCWNQADRCGRSPRRWVSRSRVCTVGSGWT